MTGCQRYGSIGYYRSRSERVEIEMLYPLMFLARGELLTHSIPGYVLILNPVFFLSQFAERGRVLSADGLRDTPRCAIFVAGGGTVRAKDQVRFPESEDKTIKSAWKKSSLFTSCHRELSFTEVAVFGHRRCLQLFFMWCTSSPCPV